MNASPRLPYVVIGAGFGGLAAAVRLRAMGHPVVVVEATDQPGGRASVFRENGFTFDAGPTVITAPYLIDELFALVGRNPADYYELMPVDPFYRVMFPDGSKFDYVGEEDRIVDQIQQMSPRDVDGYRKLAAQAERIFKVGYDQLVDHPFERVTDMLRIAPEMIKLRSFQSVYSLVSSYIKDERLRQVFTFQPLLVGGNPYATTSIYLLIHWLERKWGVWFPKGGTGALIQALVQLLGELDVPVRLNSPVEHIDVENGKAVAVRLASGERIACAGVVSNADPRFVYSKLIDPMHRRTHTDGAVNRKKGSMSLWVAYFGADRKYDDVAHHTILLGPRYKGLLDDIFDKRVLADDFSLYLHRPTASDPTLAPPGKEAFYVLSPVPNQKSGIDWEKALPEYTDRIMSSLDRGILPGIKAELSTIKTVDPRYFENDLRSVDGAAFGIEPTLVQSAYFRYHNRSEDVAGLYFVGASTHPGAGVPGVINSARVLEKVVPRPEAPIAVPPALRVVAS
jgi:phytoene desaturase